MAPTSLRPTVRRRGQCAPRVSLADELATCLDMLDEDPERFERPATSWHARWCSDIADLTLVDAHTALTALESLAGPNGTDAARVLRYLCSRQGQRGTSEVLERWIEHRARGMGSPRPLNAGSAR
jgi:hypothetical protein